MFCLSWTLSGIDELEYSSPQGGHDVHTQAIFTPEQKVAIVRHHLLENVPVSDLCDEFGIHATQYYQWQKVLFENGARAPLRGGLTRPMRKGSKTPTKRKLASLRIRCKDRNEVVAELMQEHVQLKKELGEL